MSSKNDLSLQALLSDIHPMFQSAVLQIQQQGMDLVARVRFPMLTKKSPNGTRHMLTTETRYEQGMVANQQAIKEWIETVAEDSIVLAHVECVKKHIKWPLDWPVPNYINRMETDFDRAKRRGVVN